MILELADFQVPDTWEFNPNRPIQLHVSVNGSSFTNEKPLTINNKTYSVAEIRIEPTHWGSFLIHNYLNEEFTDSAKDKLLEKLYPMLPPLVFPDRDTWLKENLNSHKEYLIQMMEFELRNKKRQYGQHFDNLRERYNV